MDNKDKIILHLCADIGSDSLPYREAGYDVRCIGKEIGIENFMPPKNVYGVIANPPCTMFSIARGTRAKKPRDLREGMKLVKECLRIIWECQYDTPINNFKGTLKFWVIENPLTGMLKEFLGKPTYSYCPSEFGAEFTKRTALWGKFIPPIKPFMKYGKLLPGNSYATDICSKVDTKNMHELMNKRSECYKPFAQAFFLANQ